MKRTLLNITRTWIILILAAMFFVVSCKKDEEAINETLELVKYLESSVDPISFMPSIRTAEQVYTSNLTDDVYIIDVRAAADYDTAHIENAVNVSLANILNHLETTDLSAYDEIVLVCYSGQSAAWGASLLRLAGFNNVFSMKFGMSSWHPNFSGPWNGNVSNQYFGDYETTAHAKPAQGSLPELNTGFEDPEDILDARIDVIFAEGFGEAGIGNSTVMGATGNYFIVNYWPENQYLDPGHIPGAYQYTPKADMVLAEDLKTLPTDQTVVVYCYTGQTSAYMAAYLRLLGYDAKSLKFGANGMIYDNMPQSKWSAPAEGYAYWTPGM